MSEKGKLIVISGPSGAGKGTICKRVLSEIDVPTKLSISMTTRKPREGEENGISYYFVSIEQFLAEIESDGLLEYARVYENYYGTPREMVMDEIYDGVNVVLEIDIQGALQVKENYPDAILIFTMPPSMKVLKERLINRGTDSESEIKKRLGETLSELSFIEKYDYCVINDDLSKAVGEVKEIIKGENLEKYRITKDITKVIDGYKEEIK